MKGFRHSVGSLGFSISIALHCKEFTIPNAAAFTIGVSRGAYEAATSGTF